MPEEIDFLSPEEQEKVREELGLNEENEEETEEDEEEDQDGFDFLAQAFAEIIAAQNKLLGQLILLQKGILLELREMNGKKG